MALKKALKPPKGQKPGFWHGPFKLRVVWFKYRFLLKNLEICISRERMVIGSLEMIRSQSGWVASMLRDTTLPMGLYGCGWHTPWVGFCKHTIPWMLEFACFLRGHCTCLVWSEAISRTICTHLKSWKQAFFSILEERIFYWMFGEAPIFSCHDLGVIQLKQAF